MTRYYVTYRTGMMQEIEEAGLASAFSDPFVATVTIDSSELQLEDMNYDYYNYSPLGSR